MQGCPKQWKPSASLKLGALHRAGFTKKPASRKSAGFATGAFSFCFDCPIASTQIQGAAVLGFSRRRALVRKEGEWSLTADAKTVPQLEVRAVNWTSAGENEEKWLGRYSRARAKQVRAFFKLSLPGSSVGQAKHKCLSA